MDRDDIERKLNSLKEFISGFKKAGVAFSGGTDSTLLLKVCLEVLGPEKVRAFTALSPLVPRKEQEEARRLSRLLQVKDHRFLEVPSLTTYPFRHNTFDRCYHCKGEIYDRFQGELKAVDNNIPLLEGTNREDLEDYRPGLEAARERRACFPLVEAGMGKEEVREAARFLGLPNWNKPAQACLASRIPYGEEITLNKLCQVEEGERFLQELGFFNCRLRHHGSWARLEIPREKQKALLKRGEEIKGYIQKLGFDKVVLDLEGRK